MVISNLYLNVVHFVKIGVSWIKQKSDEISAASNKNRSPAYFSLQGVVYICCFGNINSKKAPKVDVCTMHR
jgi:hypothetical protein